MLLASGEAGTAVWEIDPSARDLGNSQVSVQIPVPNVSDKGKTAGLFPSSATSVMTITGGILIGYSTGAIGHYTTQGEVKKILNGQYRGRIRDLQWVASEQQLITGGHSGAVTFWKFAASAVPQTSGSDFKQPSIGTYEYPPVDNSATKEAETPNETPQSTPQRKEFIPVSDSEDNNEIEASVSKAEPAEANEETVKAAETESEPAAAAASEEPPKMTFVPVDDDEPAKPAEE